MMILAEYAPLVRDIIARAEADGLTIDDGNVVDLLADNLNDLSISQIRLALIVAGLAARFPRASRSREAAP